MNLRVSKEEFVRAESLGQQVHALGSISVQLKPTRQTQKDKTGSQPEASVYRSTISVKKAQKVQDSGSAKKLKTKKLWASFVVSSWSFWGFCGPGTGTVEERL